MTTNDKLTARLQGTDDSIGLVLYGPGVWEASILDVDGEVYEQACGPTPEIALAALSEMF